MSVEKPLPASVWKRQNGELDFEQPDRWFKGEFCNPFPTNRAIHPSDVLLCWSPPAPIVNRRSKVIAFGSAQGADDRLAIIQSLDRSTMK